MNGPLLFGLGAVFGAVGILLLRRRSPSTVLRERQVTLETQIEQREAEAERAMALYQLLAENATDLVSTHRPDGRFDYASPNWTEYVGSSPSGKLPVDLSHPDDVELLVKNHLLSLQSREPITTVWRCRRPDNSYGWLETRTRPVRMAGTERVVTFVCATRDITERVRLEKELGLLHNIILSVSSAATLDEALSVTLRHLCEATGWNYGEAWVPSDDGTVIERSAVWYGREGSAASRVAEASKGLKQQRGEGIGGSAWESGEILWIRDTSSDPRLLRATVAKEAGFGAGVAVPVVAEGAVVAVLAFMMTASVPADEARVGFVSVVAAQLGSLIVRKQATQELANERRFLEALLDSLSEGIVAVDAEGTLRLTNRATRELHGGSMADVGPDEAAQHFNLYRLDGVTHLTREELPLIRVLRGHEVRGQEFCIKTANGDLRTVSANGRLIVDEDGKQLGAVVATRDITESKEVERLKDEFISVVSHELRTPLTSIRGSLGLLASGQLASAPDKSQRMLAVAVTNTDRLIRLINDILDVERISSGAVAMDLARCDGAEIARGVAEAMRPMAERAGVTITVLAGRAPLLADADRITQTLTNLVGNAVKFSPAGTAVEICVEPRIDDTLFEVRDRGRGIPPDKLETIFERFQQVDASDSREKGGTGLGLAISREIVRQHGGRIWGENAPGGGSIFKFSLPNHSDSAAAMASVARHDGGRERHVRILVIEDDIELAYVIATTLEERGFAVNIAHDGAAAIDSYNASGADVLIVDLTLPDLNGLDVVEQIRGKLGAPRAPTIVYTAADPDLATSERIRRMGAELATKGRVSTEALVESVIKLVPAPRSESATVPSKD